MCNQQCLCFKRFCFEETPRCTSELHDFSLKKQYLLEEILLSSVVFTIKKPVGPFSSFADLFMENLSLIIVCVISYTLFRSCKASKQLKDPLPISTSGRFRISLEEERLTWKKNVLEHQGQEHPQVSLSFIFSPKDLPQH